MISEGSNSYKEDKPKLSEDLTVKEVRMLISAWTTAEDSPLSYDMDMMADYFRGLVRHRCLDSLDTCVSCLHR